MTTLKDFIASLPPALTRQGRERASDVTLAKRIRSELQLAVTRGMFPEGTKCSVRIDHHSSLATSCSLPASWPVSLLEPSPAACSSAAWPGAWLSLRLPGVRRDPVIGRAAGHPELHHRPVEWR